MGTTLKVYSYRGSNVYIRWLGGLWYEALFTWDEGICAHQLQLLKPSERERRNSLSERHKGAETELMMIVAAKIDALWDSRSIQKRIKDFINYLWQKISNPQEA